MSEQAYLLLDEPFGALDALTRLEMQQWLLDIWQNEKRTVLMITHSIEEALLLADRIYVLSAKPATVLEEVIVPFERPRLQTLRMDPVFIEKATQLYRLLGHS
jgi:ABC-type nitrate/sulfonate/bicarbonate transport system ATPase subunit